MAEYIVQTNSGKVRGYERDGIIEYLGIPYAEAPVGALRFKRSLAKAPWEGVFDAKEYGSPAVQFDEGKPRGSEDCLFVNIQRPLEGEKLPVFVWIHGGGYNTGAASDGIYNGKAFVRDGLVFVSFQYRMNVLGFYDFTTFPGCENFDSNCGLSDQILALKFIRNNIHRFGGNADNITVFGQSAGAACMLVLMGDPKTAGLFDKAIVQSACVGSFWTEKQSQRLTYKYLKMLGVSPDELNKLKDIDIAKIHEANAGLRKLVLHEGNVLAYGTPKDTITAELISKIYGVDVEVNSLHDDKVRVCVPIRELDKERTG